MFLAYFILIELDTIQKFTNIENEMLTKEKKS